MELAIVTLLGLLNEIQLIDVIFACERLIE